MNKVKNNKFEEIRHKKIVSVIIASCFAIASFLIILSSPAFPWSRNFNGTDSSVFLTIGHQMEDGKMPYRDTFDHKGPLLYLINYFGVLLNESYGIFIFEFLAIFFTLWFIYKIISLKLKSQPTSALLALVAFTPFLIFYSADFGNLTEEYAMPFIAGSLYIFLKYLLTGKASRLSIFIAGASFACVSMLRINMVSIWLVFCLAILVINIKKKQFKELGKNIAFFALGIASVLAPISCWLVYNGIFGDFLNVYIKFNLSYSKSSIVSIVKTAIYFTSVFIIFSSLALTVYYALRGKDAKEKNIFRIYFAVVAASVLMACMSGRNYSHYGMVLVPLTAFPLAVLYEKLNKLDTANVAKTACLILLLTLVSTNWLSTFKSSAKTLRNYNKEKTHAVVDQICGFIDQSTGKTDEIAVYGNWDYIYLRCNRMPASKYSYQFPIGSVQPAILDEFFEEVSIKRPKVFVVQSEYENYEEGRVLNFLNANGYTEEYLDGETKDRLFYKQQ